MKYLLFCLLTLTSILVEAQVEFSEEKDWNKILAEAERADKLVFVDAYTDWCGWCKVMDKRSFPDSALGAFMNSRFINVKLEMEKDDWGIKLAKKYAVSSFPSFLIFRADGSLLGFTGGYQPAEDFQKTLKSVLEKSDTQRPGFSSAFDADYPEFYNRVFTRNDDGESTFPKDSVVNAWMDDHRDELNKEEVFAPFLRFRYTLSPDNLAAYYASREVIAKRFGSDFQEELEGEIVFLEVLAELKADSTADLKDLIAERKQTLNLDDEKTDNIWVFYHEKKEDWKAMGRVMDRIFERSGVVSAFWWNQKCWTLYEECDDQETLKRAAKWMKATCEAETDWAYLDTHAALLFKTGQYKEAKEVAQQAIQLGKETEANIEDTVKLLERIEEKLN